jgi:AraC family transcriptional regulator
MSTAIASATLQKTLSGGSFFGAIQKRSEHSSAIFTELSHSAPRKLPEHSHELAFFALILQGQYGERFGREQRQFSPFTVMFRPSGIPHQDEIGPSGVHFFEVELRPVWQARLADCSGNLRAPLNDDRGGQLLWLLLQLYRASLAGSHPEALCVESLLSEIIGYAARLPFESGKQAPRWLRRTIEQLRAEHCRKLTLGELSHEAGVHSVHLSRVFRRFTGCGIGEYVHRLRIRTACELLSTTGLTLADISFATGFADQSHFTRAFRRIAATTPSTFRSSIISRA